MKVTVKEVITKADRRKFVDFVNVMYKDVPQFIPAMYGDDLDDWDKEKNPAFDYCEARCFLAYDENGNAVGRIGAILSHAANEKWNVKRMRFTQVDFIDDYDVSAALFKTVEDWAREKGMNEVHGPLGFCDCDREGMLVEGFDRQSMFITYYNYPYYNDHLARLGYVKDADWMEYLIEVPYDDKTTDFLKALSERALRSRNLHVKKMKNRSEYSAIIDSFFRLVNVAYSNLYGVVELNDRQIAKYAKKYVPLINPDLACFVMDENEKLVAFGVCAPSMAKALKKSSGRLFPFGWIGVLNSLKNNDTADLLLIAVDPELHGAAVNSIVMYNILEGMKRSGIRYAETGPQLELNTQVRAQWKMLKKEQHKRRRCYIKQI